MKPNLTRRLAAEFLGTATLLAVIVGSGIMAERLAAGNVAVALLGHTLAIAAGLFALILTFDEISTHFNPVVTLTQLLAKHISIAEACVYVVVQMAGAVAGVVLANVMFGLPAVFVSEKPRTGAALWLSEAIATFGLIVVIAAAARIRSKFAVPIAVSTYIFAAIWFTSSFSFANPAVTVARSMSDSFAGIRPVDVPGFIVAQIIGAVAAMYLSEWLFSESEPPA